MSTTLVKGKQLTFEEAASLPIGTPVWLTHDFGIGCDEQRTVTRIGQNGIEVRHPFTLKYCVITKKDLENKRAAIYEVVEEPQQKEEGSVDSTAICSVANTISKLEIHKELTSGLSRLYEDKNADYGDSFSKLRNEFGNTAILIRLSDKLERLKTLMTGSKQKVSDESIEDTLRDLANYSLMELVEIKYEKIN